MNLENAIEKYFNAKGFQAEWVYMNREAFFLLVWKGQQLQIHYVDAAGCIEDFDVSSIKEAFFELLGFLRCLSLWQKNFQGREITFKWLMLEEPTALQAKILKTAGVEPFLFDMKKG
jgi:hypothetical protein